MTALVEAPALESTARAPARSLHYLRAYGSAFEGPHWRNNLLYGSLCILIPVVGQIAFDGYCYEVIEKNTSGKPGPNPRFEFNRFTDYLTRGAWPFVIQLILQVTLQPLLIVVSDLLMVGLMFAAIAAGPRTGPLMFGLGFTLWLLVMLAFAVVLGLVLCPLMLRAGLAQDFVKAFNFRWILDFIRRVWLEVVLVQLFFLCTMPMLLLFGFLMCGVGIFPAGTVLHLAATNLSHQLYNLYLARGGTPVPLKAPPSLATTQPTPEGISP